MDSSIICNMQQWVFHSCFQTDYNLKFPRNIHLTKAIYFFLQRQITETLNL